MKSEKFDMINDFFIAGTWSLERVWNVVGKVITEDEYTQITGLAYPDKETLEHDDMV